jgi:hypothetical protein
MKTLLHFCLVALFAASTTSIHAASTDEPINAILGDASFVQTFGYAPSKHTSEVLRIQTHLEYVETLLRKRDVSHLSAAAQQERAYLLDKLHEYWLAGRFPKNLAYQTRRPCFIDQFGNICAVGYLVEQSAGRALAERVNAQHQYEYISTMTMPELHAWVRSSGLTVEECGMIQPTYGPYFDPNFKILDVTPSVTTANKTMFPLMFTVTGIPGPTIPTSDIERVTNLLNRYMTVDFQGVSMKHLSGVEAQIVSSATLSRRFDGTIRFMLPANMNTEGIYTITLYTVYPGVSYIYYSNTTTLTITANTTSSITFSNEPQLDIFPNPTHNAFTIRSSTEQVRMRLLTALGEEVLSERVIAAREQRTFDLGGLPSGVYFAEITDGTTRRVRKVVKY